MTTTTQVRRGSIEDGWEIFDSAALSWLGLNRADALAAIRRDSATEGDPELDPLDLPALVLLAPSLQT